MKLQNQLSGVFKNIQESLFGTLALYFQCIFHHQNISLVGGSSIHKWFEITVSYCIDRMVSKDLLFVGCVVMQTRQG